MIRICDTTNVGYEKASSVNNCSQMFKTLSEL